MRWQRVDTGMSMGLAVSQRGFRAKRLDAGILRLPLGQLSSVEIQASQITSNEESLSLYRSIGDESRKK